jgi:hypothetical protein
MTDDFDRRFAARKKNVTEADDLFVFLAELEGGGAELEGTPQRFGVFRWVVSHPRYDKRARAAIMAREFVPDELENISAQHGCEIVRRVGVMRRSRE